MKLKLADGTVVEDPDRESIARFLHTLDGETNNFAILGPDEQTYLQTEGGPDRGFVLEYQQGSMDAHFRTTDYSLPLDAIVAAFQEYAASDEAWKARYQWEKEELATGGCLGAAIVFFLTFGGVL